MIFYKVFDPAGKKHFWTGTQAEARAIAKAFEQVEVPTDKPGLLIFLNRWQEASDELNRLSEVCRHPSDNVPEREETALTSPTTPQPDPHVKASLDFSAETRRQISVEEEIQNCDLPRLATYASNVAWRFKELSEKCQSSQSFTI